MRGVANEYRGGSAKYASSPQLIFRDAIVAMTAHLPEAVLKEQSEFLNYLSFRGPAELAAPASAFINAQLSTRGLSVKALHPFRYYILAHQSELCTSYLQDMAGARSTRGAFESLLASGSFESDSVGGAGDAGGEGAEGDGP